VDRKKAPHGLSLLIRVGSLRGNKKEKGTLGAKETKQSREFEQT